MRTRAWWVATAALLLAACSGTPDAETPPDGSSPSTAGSSAAAASESVVVEAAGVGQALAPPFTVTGGDASKSQVVGPAGGTLAVTGDDGTAYTLDIPAGALLETVEITATPADSLGNGNQGGRGVVFAPSGLQFATDATLTVTPERELPPDQQLVFEFTDDGDEVIAAEPVLDEPAIVMYVGHFSGYGFADLANTAREKWVGWRTENAEEEIQNELRDVLATERYQQLLGVEQGAGTPQKIIDAYKRYEKEVVRPRLKNADTSCDAAKTAMRTALSHMRNQQLLTLPDADPEHPMTLVESVSVVIKPCEKEAIEKCRANRDPGTLLDLWKGVNQVLPGTFDVDRSKAELICDPRAYRIVGGLQDWQVDNEVCDISKPFRLTGEVGTMRLSGGLSGTYTFSGAAESHYTGTYRFTFPDGPRKSGTLVGSGGGTISGQAGSGTEKYTVTPIGPAC